MEEMRNKLEDVVITFSDDEKSLILIEELTTRFKELMNTEFTEEDFMSDEFDEMKEDYYIDCNQSEVSEITIFDVLLFNQI